MGQTKIDNVNWCTLGFNGRVGTYYSIDQIVLTDETVNIHTHTYTRKQWDGLFIEADCIKERREREGDFVSEW